MSKMVLKRKVYAKKDDDSIYVTDCTYRNNFSL